MKQEIKTTPDNIQELKENEIFVFGSNEAGIHGAGAAKLANDNFGATYKQGFGLSGNTFALPTKDFNIKTLPLDKIKEYIDIFSGIVELNKDKHFLITEIGCGLAGYIPKDIAPLFKDFINYENISLPKSFIDILFEPIIIQVYKMTDENMICKPKDIPFKYELGKKYFIDEKVIICETGFHSCSTAQNCLNYYDNNGKNRLFLCEIEINGSESFENNENIENFTKIATDNITFIKELTNLSKEFNSGNWNSGNRNSGNKNSGNFNCGNFNSGNWNSGDWNSGDFNSGDLNSISNLRFIFNKPTTILDKDIYYPSWLYFNLNVWIHENDMSEIEKENNSYYKTLGGYLKTYDFKEAAQERYNKATKSEQRSIEDLPNYDAEVLYEIFGIDRRKK